MPTPQSSRSTYRKRRINLMLRGGQEVDTQNAASTTLPRRPRRRRSKKLVIALSVTTAVLWAVAVFFILFRHDSDQFTPSIPARPVPREKVAVDSNPQPVVSTPDAAPPAPIVTPIPAEDPKTQTISIHFRVKRSARFQLIGPIGVKLVNTNPKKGLCSLLLNNGVVRPNQRTVLINRPIHFFSEDGTPTTLLISAITKEAVNGLVTSP